MANFLEALPHILKNEGGYSNVSGDTGGETYRGISRNNYPYWHGWAIIDRYKPLKDEELIDNSALDSLIEDFYKDNFWLSNKLNEINNQEVATKLFDMCVNMGSYRGVILLQEVLVNKFRNAINIDGKVGKETIRCINQADLSLIEQLRQRCVKFYTDLAIHPEKRKFLVGWLKRAKQ